MFVLKEDDGEKLHLRISTDRDVEDWEYGAIFDNYNYDSYGDNVIEIDEIDNDYNPVWEIVIDYDDNLSVVEERVAEILDIHSNELKRVYEEIKDKESEYKMIDKRMADCKCLCYCCWCSNRCRNVFYS